MRETKIKTSLLWLFNVSKFNQNYTNHQLVQETFFRSSKKRNDSDRGTAFSTKV